MKAKVLHTSDWHLGKKVFGLSLLPEQTLFLSWLESKIQSENIQSLVISGDIFDVPSPGHEALDLFYQFLKTMALHQVETFVMSGNHDSALFLDAQKHFLGLHHIHLLGSLANLSPGQWPLYSSQTEQFDVLILPYTRPVEWINWAKKEGIDIPTESPTLGLMTEYMSRAPKKRFSKRLLMAHHGFGHFTSAGSEFSLYADGIEHLPLSLFPTSIDYVALGHIHQFQEMQKAPKTPIVYSGSPIPYRHEENAYKKIVLVEIKDEEAINYSTLDVPIFRQRVTFKGDTNTIKEQCESFISDYQGKSDSLPPWFLMNFKDRPPSTEEGLYLKQLSFKIDAKILAFNWQGKKQRHNPINSDVRHMSLPGLFEQYTEGLGLKVQEKKDYQEIFNQLINFWQENQVED